jgi:hypothetical protein
MLNEILSEFEKVRDKDRSTKKNVRDLISGVKDELKMLEFQLEETNGKMTVRDVTILTNRTRMIQGLVH